MKCIAVGIPVMVCYKTPLFGIQYYLNGEQCWDRFAVNFDNIMGVIQIKGMNIDTKDLNNGGTLYINVNQPLMVPSVKSASSMTNSEKLEKRFGKSTEQILFESVIDLLNGFELHWDNELKRLCGDFKDRRKKMVLSKEKNPLGMSEDLAITYVTVPSYKRVLLGKAAWCDTIMFPENLYEVDIEVHPVNYNRQLELGF